MKKVPSQQNSQALYNLMHELGKARPDHKIIQSLCEQANIVYDTDIIQLMAKVLVASSHIRPNKMKTEAEA